MTSLDDRARGTDSTGSLDSGPAFEKPARSAEQSARSSAEAKSPEFQIAERADWTLFRSLNTLPQQAGVPLSQMRCLVLKELVDNGLDVSAVVDVRRTPGGVYVVRDRGPGISDDPAEIARRFSIKRPLLSSKLNRMPTRGALGNGLRVVVGAVLASKGTLDVVTRNRLFTLTPHDD